MAKSVDPDQTAPIGAVCSGSTLFASILNSSVFFFFFFFFFVALRPKSTAMVIAGRSVHLTTLFPGQA